MLGTHILIHHSAGHDGPGLDYASIKRFHTQEKTPPWKDIGYHAVVEKVGEEYVVVMGRPLHWNGAHCPGMNAVAYGVCFVGDFTSGSVPDAQLKVGARFVAGLAHQMKIPILNIEPHRDHRSTDCPGKSFPWERFKKLVQEYRDDVG
jgi:N-acetyl-anhydromuramyl-L-alanine amidase AmpD